MTKRKNGIKLSTILLLIAGVLFCVITPRVNQGYSMMVMNVALIYAIASYGLSVMLGMGGQLSFATVSFMGVGAYITANLCTGRQGLVVNSFAALLLSIVVSALLAYLLGLVLFRLKGTYFTFATIGLVQIAWCFYLNYKPLFGGPDGISGVPTIKLFGFSPRNYNQWFYVLIVFVLLTAIVVEMIRRSQLGRSLAAIRDDEIAAQTLGVNVFMTKVIAFTIAGAMAGLSGSLYAMHSQFVSSDMFTFERATIYIIMVMLGGVNNTVGVFLGSVLVTMLPEWLRGMQQYLQLIYGVGVILLMVFMPMGLAGLASSLSRSLKKRLHAKPAVAKGVSK